MFQVRPTIQLKSQRTQKLINFELQSSLWIIWVSNPTESFTPAQSTPPTKMPATRYTWFSHQALSHSAFNAGFLGLSASGILGPMASWFLVVGGCPVHDRILSSFPRLCPLDPPSCDHYMSHGGGQNCLLYKGLCPAPGLALVIKVCAVNKYPHIIPGDSYPPRCTSFSPPDF